MIKKLTIPCIVTGVGLRAPYEPDFTTGFSFDNDVKEFVKAVLEKSAMLGLRGEITGKYLNKLGFKEERDYTIIGCPSLYMNGANLNTRIKKINENSTVCYNSSLYSDENIRGFIKEIEKSFPKNYFIMQELKELKLLHSGLPFEADEEYPCKKMSDSCYLENKARFFINVPSWIEFMKQADLSIGTRFHGNVASILAGTQTLFIPHDARTRELIEYHGLPNINNIVIYGAGELGKRLYEDISHSNIEIKYVIDKVNNDFYDIEVRLLEESSFENVDAIIITPVLEYESITKKIRDDVKKISLQTIVDFLYEMNNV